MKSNQSPDSGGSAGGAPAQKQPTRNSTSQCSDWLAATIGSASALLIGCGEGALAVELAKAGSRVHGIDVSAKNIVGARKRLKKEQDEVRERVAFTNESFPSTGLEGRSFGAIVLSGASGGGIFLGRQLNAIHSSLSSDGKFVALLPYGTSALTEVKKTLELQFLCKAISATFEIDDIHIQKEWIGISASRKTEAEGKKSARQAVSEGLDGLASIFSSRLRIAQAIRDTYEDKVLPSISGTGTSQRQLQAQLHELREQLNDRLLYIDHIEPELALAQEKRRGHYLHLEAERKKTRELKEKLDNATKELAVATTKLSDVRRMHEDRSAQVKRLEAQRDDLKKQLEAARTRHENWLSYQLGMAMIASTKSLRAALLLPFVLFRILEAHRGKKIHAKAKSLKVMQVANGLDAPATTKAPIAQPSIAELQADKDISSTTPHTPPANASEKSEALFASVELEKSYKIKLPFEKVGIDPTRKLRVASIMDTFTDACFASECELIRIKPDSWRNELEKQDIDMLFVESAWNGNNGAWLYRVAKYNALPGNELSDAIAWCKERNIPTVFWNKEDPPNFDRFVARAAEFDHIFTTDQNCIPRYKESCPGAKTIEALPFAAQPAIHNPIMEHHRKEKTFFAGTYYADDFVDRRNWMDLLLRSAKKVGLDIFDRMYNAAPADKARYLFPADLQENVIGKLSYDETLQAYRSYKVSLNVNSVFDSPTMFSRRVFELLACGTPVVSTPSLGIGNFFGGLVPLVDKAAEADEAMRKLMQDNGFWLRQSARGIREVYEKHTYAHRVHTISDVIGLNANSLSAPTPEIVVALDADGDPDAIVENLRTQHTQPAAIIVTGSAERDQAVAAHMAALQAAGYKPIAMPKPNVASFLHERFPDAAVAFWKSSCYYGPSYLRDGRYSARYGNQDIASGIKGHFRLVDGQIIEDMSAAGDYGLLVNEVHPGSIVMSVRCYHDHYCSRQIEPKAIYLNRYGFDFFPDQKLDPAQRAAIELGV